jgi:hypothetical protein
MNCHTTKVKFESFLRIVTRQKPKLNRFAILLVGSVIFAGCFLLLTHWGTKKLREMNEHARSFNEITSYSSSVMLQALLK